MSFQVGDGIALASVAYRLYANVFVVAKHAPEDFRDLLKELRLVKNITYEISSTLENVEDSVARDVIENCISLLDQFRPLISKFQCLAFTDHKIWPARLKYAKDQKTVKECRKELQNIKQTLLLIPLIRNGKHTCKFNPNSNQQQQPFTSDPVGSRSNEKAENASETQRLNDKSLQLMDSGIGSSRDSIHTNHSPQRHEVKQSGVDQPPKFDLPDQSAFLSTRSSSHDSRVNTGRNTERSYARVFRDAHDQTQHFTLDKALLEMLDPPQHELPRHIEEWCEMELAKIERAHDYHVTLSSWLFIGVWWLVKSRTLRYILDTAQNRNAGEAETRDHKSIWTRRISRLQAATDLLKSLCILRWAILAHLKDGTSLSQAQWKAIQDLTAAIKHDTEANPDFRDLCDTKDHVFQVSGEFAEPFVQAVEYLSSRPEALDSIEGPQRWLAVDLQHCGSKEKVLFRTFVNAQLGDRSVCRKSETAPYILLLWSKLGKSELELTLVNQHGTVHLARAMTVEDLRFYEDHTGAGTEFEFDFPSQEAVIQFLSEQDVEEFLSHPRKLFAATKARNPRDCELLVRRYPLDAYVSRYPSRKDGNSMGVGAAAGSAHTACEISLFDMVPHELWKTTRRLVIASTPGVQEKPWSVEFFLPLSMVQVRRAQKDVRLIWSDFTTLVGDTQGEYDKRWSYVYTPDNPTFELHVVFKNSSEAEAFVESILQPFQTPFEAPEYVENQQNFETPSLARELRVYQLRDRNVTQKVGYYALCLTKQTPNTNHSSEVYFVHRDIDFKFGKVEQCNIDFISLQVPHYHSNMRDLNAQPKPDDRAEPVFARAARRSRDVRFAFEAIDDVNRLMKSILGWDLKHIQHAKRLKILSKARFIPKAQSDIGVSLWQQDTQDGKSLRIAMRTEHNIDLRWTTAALDATSRYKRKSNKIILKNVCLQQGHQVDGKFLVATDPSLPEQPHDVSGTLTLVFDRTSQAEELVKWIYKLLHDWIPRPENALPRNEDLVRDLFAKPPNH